MSDKFKDKACSWLTKKKSTLGKVILTGVYAFIFAFLLIGLTTAKYAEKRTVYSGFDAARFNAVILGDIGKINEAGNRSEAQALSVLKDNTKDIKVFGDTLDASKLQPGEGNKKSLHFTVSNGIIPLGKDKSNVAEVSEKYSIILRTTGYLPLDFKLTEADAYGNPTYYYPGPAEMITPTLGDEQDIKWYQYRFYVDNATAMLPDNETKNEATFTLELKNEHGVPGKNGVDGDLAVNLHSFEFVWPIKQLPDGSWSNDERYMKEVDVIEAYVSVTSLPNNGSGENINGGTINVLDNVSTVPTPVHSPKTSTGTLRLHDNGTAYNYGQPQTHKGYLVDMRAIKNNSFSLEINDGITAWRGVDNKTVPASLESKFKEDHVADNYPDTVPEKTYYNISLQVPVYNEIENTTIADTYKLRINGGTEYEKTGSSYFIYDAVNDAFVKTLSATTNEAAMAEYIAYRDSKSEYTKSRHLEPDDYFDRYYLYRTDTFAPAETWLVENSNIVTATDNTTGTVKITEVKHHSDKVEIIRTGSGISDNVFSQFAVTHKINLVVDYMFSEPYSGSTS